MNSTTPAQTQTAQTTADSQRKNDLQNKLKNLALNVKELIHYTGNNPATLPSNRPL